jgi:FtsZ-binding cell division protein ZapB
MPVNQNTKQVDPAESKEPVQASKEPVQASEDVRILKAQIENLTKANETLLQKVSESETKRAELATRALGDELKGFVEVVAIPHVKGLRFGPKVKSGVVYQSWIDPKDGYEHWKVPLNYAAVLCGEKAGLKHVFAGPGKYLETCCRVKDRQVFDRMPKHVANIVNGEYVWQPVGEE